MKIFHVYRSLQFKYFVNLIVQRVALFRPRPSGFITHNFGNEKVQRSLIFLSIFCPTYLASALLLEINGKIAQKMIHAITTRFAKKNKTRASWIVVPSSVFGSSFNFITVVVLKEISLSNFNNR